MGTVRSLDVEELIRRLLCVQEVSGNYVDYSGVVVMGKVGD